jgi:hypothetical protein
MLITVTVAVLVIGSLVAFVMAHVVLLACCLAAAGVVLGGFAVWSRWISSPARLAELRAAERAELPAAKPAVALPRGWSASRPALPAPVEYHVHLHGVSAEDMAAILRSNRQ